MAERRAAVESHELAKNSLQLLPQGVFITVKIELLLHHNLPADFTIRIFLRMNIDVKIAIHQL